MVVEGRLVKRASNFCFVEREGNDREFPRDGRKKSGNWTGG